MKVDTSEYKIVEAHSAGALSVLVTELERKGFKLWGEPTIDRSNSYYAQPMNRISTEEKAVMKDGIWQ